MKMAITDAEGFVSWPAWVACSAILWHRCFTDPHVMSGALLFPLQCCRFLGGLICWSLSRIQGSLGCTGSDEMAGDPNRLGFIFWKDTSITSTIHYQRVRVPHLSGKGSFHWTKGWGVCGAKVPQWHTTGEVGPSSPCNVVKVKKFKVIKAYLLVLWVLGVFIPPSVFVVSLLILDEPFLLFPVLEDYMEYQ
jgi:hypothetical protein